jgi:hypothetical protein
MVPACPPLQEVGAGARARGSHRPPPATLFYGFMEPLARFIFWVAVAAWAAVAAAFLVRLVRDWND